MINARVFAIRPDPGLTATITAGVTHGIPIIGHSLSRAEKRGWTLPDLSTIDGLLIGSGNAIRQAGDKLDALRHLPALAVGHTTATVASDAGLQVEVSGAGGLQSVLDGLSPAPRHLLRLAGEEHIDLNPPENIQLTTRIVYRMKTLEMSDQFAAMLASECIVLLHSASAAGHFASECDRMSVDRSPILLAALGPRILEPVGAGWRAVCAAEKAEDSALLALVRNLCH
jgi:uroporphyrinogen-III synthase